MDGLRSGLGEVLATLELGNVGNWVSGIVAATSLFLSIRTSRAVKRTADRQQADRFLAKIHIFEREQTARGYPPAAKIELVNFSDDTMQDVVIRCNIPDKKHVKDRGSAQAHMEMDFSSYLKYDDVGIDMDEFTLSAKEFPPLLRYKAVVRTSLPLVKAVTVEFTDRNGRRWKRSGDGRKLEGGKPAL